MCFRQPEGWVRAAWSTSAWPAVYLVTVCLFYLETGCAKRLQNKEDASEHMSSFPIPVLGSVCFTVTQKLWVARVSFSLITWQGDASRESFWTFIDSVSPSFCVISFASFQPTPWFGIHSPQAAAGLYHSNFVPASGHACSVCAHCCGLQWSCHQRDTDRQPIQGCGAPNCYQSH